MGSYIRTKGYCKDLPDKIVASDYSFQKYTYGTELSLLYHVLSYGVKSEKITERQYKDIRNELMNFNDKFLSVCFPELLTILEMPLEEQETFARKYDSVFSLSTFKDKEGRNISFRPEHSVFLLRNIVSRMNTCSFDINRSLKTNISTEKGLTETIDLIRVELEVLKDENSWFSQTIYQNYYQCNQKYLEDPFLARLVEKNKIHILNNEKEKLQHLLRDYERRLSRLQTPVSTASKAVFTYYKKKK
ncbi:MAG: hypothetical protein E7168_05375 [Firmicutes bacterium]|nr:hypothetical protein [Bacillota bacterium]